MYDSGYRAAGRTTIRRSRTQSDPGHQYPPYRTPWPTPARRITEPMDTDDFLQRMPSSSRKSSIISDPSVPSHGSFLTQAQTSGSPGGTGPSTPASPHSGSPQRSAHRRSSSQGISSRIQQGPLVKEIPQPSRTALNTPAVQIPQTAGLGQGSGSPPTFPMPQPQTHSALPEMSSFQGTSTARQGSHQIVHQQTQFTGQQSPNTAYHASLSNSNPLDDDHHRSNSYHSTRRRSRSRPPSAASHRYASTITPPMYGHGSSGPVDASLHTGGIPPRSHSTGPSGAPGAPGSLVRPGAHSTGTQGRSQSHTRPTPSTMTATTAHSHSKPNEIHSSEPAPTPPAKDLHRTSQRPVFPSDHNGTQTRYVNMLLALDDIAPLFNLLASFFTWVLLAGFILFPGTFASWKNKPATETEQEIIGIIDNISLYVIAWVCTGIGAFGMMWLWWRWQSNYIWITNRVFLPGLMNSLAGVISTLSSVYGAQGGVFSVTAKSTIIVTGAISVICGLLVLVYQFWLLRNIRKEHDRVIGVEKAGKHGEGVLGEKKSGQKREV